MVGRHEQSSRENECSWTAGIGIADSCRAGPDRLLVLKDPAWGAADCDRMVVCYELRRGRVGETIATVLRAQMAGKHGDRKRGDKNEKRITRAEPQRNNHNFDR